MKVAYLVEVDHDPMERLDPSAEAKDILRTLEEFSDSHKAKITVTAALDPWAAMNDGNKNELIKLAHKSIRHGFGDHPEMITDMNALSASIAKRLAGELWARRKR